MIEVRELTKRFDVATAVDDVSFDVGDGEVLALVGTSGCGKSTTLRMINRLVEPTAGTVRIDGSDAAEMRLEALRLGIGYVIQGIGLFPHWTVARNVATVLHLMRWDRARIEARVNELLELFQLDPAEFAHKYPSELSGGQQQRVGVARAMAAEPAVLLMDEPFGALDPITRARLQDEFAAIQRRRRMTVILVTHDMDEAFKLADRIAVMDAGRILQIASPEDLLRGPREGFVRQFVGLDDRALRILSLHRVAEVADAAPPGRWTPRDGGFEDGEGGRVVLPLSPGDTLREAASRIIWEDAAALPVAEGGQVTGQLRAEAVWRAGGRAA